MLRIQNILIIGNTYKFKCCFFHFVDLKNKNFKEFFFTKTNKSKILSVSCKLYSKKEMEEIKLMQDISYYWLFFDALTHEELYVKRSDYLN